MNLALGQTTWTRFIGVELGLFLGLAKVLRNEKRRYSTKRNRIQLHQVGNRNLFTNGFVLNGLLPGVNTDSKFRIYIRITDENPSANHALVELYKATGAGSGDKIASGSAADGATVTLAQANSSGVSGTVNLGTVTASESNDNHYIEVYPDWALRARAVWDGTANDDAASYKQFTDILPLLEQLEDAKISIVKAALTAFLGNRGKNLMQSDSGQSKVLDARSSTDDGTVTTSYAGFLPDINRNMADETTPSAQKVVKNVRAAGAVTFPVSNRGKGSAGAVTVTEFASIGILVATCASDSSIARQLFRLSLVDPDGNTITPLNGVELQVGRTFSDPNLGIFGLLVQPSYTYDASNDHDFATADDWSFTGQGDSNTSDGVLYYKCVAGVADPTKFAIEVYKSASFASNQLVAKTDEGASNAIVALKQKNASGLAGIGKIGSSPTALNTCTFNLNPFRPSDDQGVADQFTIAITSTSLGEFQAGLVDLFDYFLNSATSGSETIDESYVSRGTFPAFETLD